MIAVMNTEPDIHIENHTQHSDDKDGEMTRMAIMTRTRMVTMA